MLSGLSRRTGQQAASFSLARVAPLPRRQRGAMLGEVRGSGAAMTTLEAIRGERQRLVAVAARHGARNLRVFGSVARGEADEASDLDLLTDIYQQTLVRLLAQ